MKQFLFLVSLLVTQFASQSQADPGTVQEKLDRYLGSALMAYHFNGVALVAKGDQVIFHKAYGWRNVQERAQNDTATRFPILSITKSFTAMLVLRLQELGKISLKDKVSKYLDDIPNGDLISIEQLLTHNSGLYNYTNDIGEEDSALVNHPVDRNLALQIIRKTPVFKPGEDFEYNNSGYYLAGLVIEKATGKSYEENMRELIFLPLQMNRTGQDYTAVPPALKAIGYQFLDEKQQKPYTYIDSTVSYSAGDIYSTTGDLFKWTRAIARKEIISPKSWKYALDRKASDYGIGFRINSFFGHDYIKHSGGYPGFASEFIYYPKEQVTIILLKNSGNYGQDLWPVTMGMSEITLGLPYDDWKKRVPVILPVESLKENEGEYSGGKLKIRFEVKEGQLYMILPGLELGLSPESADIFYPENFNLALRFTRSGDKVDGVILHEHGKDTRLKKGK